MTPEEIRLHLSAAGCIVSPCGSRVTCSPPPMDTDEDWLVLVPMTYAGRLHELLSSEDWLVDAGELYDESRRDLQDGFVSWRSPDRVTNLIVTGSVSFWERHCAATSVCRRLNLMSKEHRIAVFRAVLYGEECP